MGALPFMPSVISSLFSFFLLPIFFLLSIFFLLPMGRERERFLFISAKGSDFRGVSQPHPRSLNPAYTHGVLFDDRISSRGPLPELAPLRAQYALLCAQLLAALIHPGAALRVTYQLRRHVRVLIQASQAHFRARQKTDMLLCPSWRERVISELGGWKRLRRWAKRQAAIAAAPREKAYETCLHPAKDDAERERRALMRELMKANAHPLILRDPCRMDFDGEFRLPPQIRLVNPLADPDYDYDFDARPWADFSGVRTPITVWPEEFKAAAEARPHVKAGESISLPLPVTPDIDPGASPSQGATNGRKPIIFLPVLTDTLPRIAGLKILASGRYDTGKAYNTGKGYASRAPPRIRGSPNLLLRQGPLAERFCVRPLNPNGLFIWLLPLAPLSLL